MVSNNRQRLSGPASSGNRPLRIPMQKLFIALNTMSSSSAIALDELCNRPRVSVNSFAKKRSHKILAASSSPVRSFEINAEDDDSLVMPINFGEGRSKALFGKAFRMLKAKRILVQSVPEKTVKIAKDFSHLKFRGGDCDRLRIVRIARTFQNK